MQSIVVKMNNGYGHVHTLDEYFINEKQNIIRNMLYNNFMYRYKHKNYQEASILIQ